MAPSWSPCGECYRITVMAYALNIGVAVPDFRRATEKEKEREERDERMTRDERQRVLSHNNRSMFSALASRHHPLHACCLSAGIRGQQRGYCRRGETVGRGHRRRRRIIGATATAATRTSVQCERVHVGIQVQVGAVDTWLRILAWSGRAREGGGRGGRHSCEALSASDECECAACREW